MELVGDNDALLQSLQAASGTWSPVGDGDDASRQAAFTSVLVDYLSVVGTDPDITSSQKTATMALATDITARGSELTSSNFDSLFAVIDIFTSAPIDDALAGGALDVISNLLGGAPRMRDGSAEQVRSAARRISAATDRLALSVAASLPVGGKKRLATATVQIEAVVELPSNFEGQAFDDAGAIQIPVGTFASGDGRALTAVIKTWPGSLGPAGVIDAAQRRRISEGAGADAGAALVLASGALSLSFFDAASSAPYKVENLAKPVKLTFPIAAGAAPPWWLFKARHDGSPAARVLCRHWDAISNEWVNDGASAYNLNATPPAIECGFSHLTDFAVWAQPPPQFNRISFSSLAEFWAENKTGFVLSASCLFVTLFSCAFGQCCYRRLAVAASQQQGHKRASYDRNASAFAPGIIPSQ
jgi:hypothetical protein